MSHPSQRDFVERVRSVFPDFFRGVRVLEVGSLDINGTVRDFFDECLYTGVDVGPGKGVDVVAEGQSLTYDDGFFDTAISAECFEHNPHWRDTFLNMHRMCSGLVVITAATEGRAEHGTARSAPDASPLTLEKWDYYQNILRADFLSFDLDGLFSIWDLSVNDEVHDIYFWGLVKGEGAVSERNARLAQELRDTYAETGQWESHSMGRQVNSEGEIASRNQSVRFVYEAAVQLHEAARIRYEAALALAESQQRDETGRG